MKTTFHADMMVGDIVTNLPKASDILKSYRIDFCCGGQRPLKEATAELNINTDEVIHKLNQLSLDIEERGKDEVKWEEETWSNLIDHIIHKHHSYLNNELPALTQYVTKVFRVHSSAHPELSKVHALFNQLKVELEKHALKEESEVFPAIKVFESNPTATEKLNDLIDELEDEHDAAGSILREIRSVTNDYSLPVDACMTYQITYQRLEDLESDMFAHIHLENNILFPSVVKHLKE
jgi:regulator of cell morphogenesis and NO signaling